MSKSNSYETLEHCRIKDISSFHTVISVNNIAWGIVVPISNINIYIGSDSTLYVCVCVCILYRILALTALCVLPVHRPLTQSLPDLSISVGPPM